MTFSLVDQIIHIQALGSVVLLVGFLIATSLLQQRTIFQSPAILDTASDRVKATALFASAQGYLERRRVPNLFTSPAHIVPVWFLIIVVLFCSSVSYFGAEFLRSRATPKVIRLDWPCSAFSSGGTRRCGSISSRIGGQSY